MKTDLTSYLRGLSEYNPMANKASEAMNKAVFAIGFILLTMFLLLEMMQWYRFVRQQNGRVPQQVWLELAFIYAACYSLLFFSSPILDGMMWLLDRGAAAIMATVKMEDFTYSFDLGTVRGLERMILSLIGGIVELIVWLVVKLVLFIRFVELYLLKALAPVFLAAMVNETTRPIAINYLKYFASYVLISLVMSAMVVIFPVFMEGGKILLLKDFSPVGMQTAIISIVQGIVYIIFIIGAGRKTQRLLGV
ncbi:TPA: type IV secretion system protein [Streptococcus suis]|uniref:type IV secretion system protein n=1 Tax=Streptococcus suis TaxID=1307 RepID=UPI000CF40952|nr:type IV secretion system protein [Streptococcus suis]MCK4023928.1 type IV secretion system protein [Streptococcus suis]MCO8200847.1 type IV secretion system protein [Streptococcus suis]MCO8218384.1 type IV secretion system protein [Streptococcus suis]HEM3467934.1 type IV secretion system protein [Streptococcus suis]HEM3478645.1 type IV secretion system protein [Streptococcus suis]